jgi:hypothetical protein
MASEVGLYRSNSESSGEGFHRSQLEAEQEQEIVDRAVASGDGSSPSDSGNGEDPADTGEVTGSRSKSVVDDAVRRRWRKFTFMIAAVPVIASSVLLGVFATTGRGDTAKAELNGFDLGTTSSPVEGATSSPSVLAVAVGSSPAPSALAKDPPSTISPSTMSQSSSSRFSPLPTTAPYILPTISPITTPTVFPVPPPPEMECISFGYCEDDKMCCSGICKIDDKSDETTCQKVKTDAPTYAPISEISDDAPKPEGAPKPGDSSKPDDSPKPEDNCKELEGDHCNDKKVCCEGLTCIEKACVVSRRFIQDTPPNRLRRGRAEGESG